MGLFGKKKEPPKPKPAPKQVYRLDEDMKWKYCKGCRQYVVARSTKHFTKTIRVRGGDNDYITTTYYKKGRHRTKGGNICRGSNRSEKEVDYTDNNHP